MSSKVVRAALAALLLLTGAPHAIADVVRMSFGETIPPYVITESDSGIAIDIAREALAFRGHSLEPVYVPLKRILRELELGKVDAAAQTQGETFDEARYHAGRPVFRYFDVFFTLERRNLEIGSPADIADLRIIAFDNAAKIFPEWLAAPAAGDDYAEVSDQTLQIKMLQRGRVDVVVADKLVIEYHAQQMAKNDGYAIAPMRVTEFTGHFGHESLFREAAIRDDFNAGLEHVMTSGLYERIVARYVD